MNITTVICTYRKSLDGDVNKLIKKYVDSHLDNFSILFDNQTLIEKEFIINKYNYSNIHLYNDLDFQNLKFDKPIDTRHRWGNHQNPKYFYAHFRMLTYYKSHPHYDYYWFFDDDVDFTGDIKAFLNNYKYHHYDFLAIQAFKKDNYPEFPHISKINNRMGGSHGAWLDWCPGPGDNFQSINKHIGSFFPIVRFSNRAMKFLEDLHNDGFYGYSEGFAPTSLASNGYDVGSMMDEYNNFFIPNNTDCVLYHKNIPFTWEWL